MSKQGKSPKKKTKEKSPQRTEESEYPEMDQDTYNRLLQNAIEHSKAELQQQLQQQHEEQLKEVEHSPLDTTTGPAATGPLASATCCSMPLDLSQLPPV